MKNQIQDNGSSSSGNIQWVHLDLRKRLVRYFLLTVSIILVLYVASTLHVRWNRIGSLSSIFAVIARFFPPNIEVLNELGGPVLETLLMAFLSTTISAIISLPVIIMGARNIKLPLKSLAYLVGRFIIIISRSVHELIWALLFVTAVGLGPFAGVLALSVRSVGFISKMMAEAIEDIDEKQVEAVKASGANAVQIWMYGILPQIIPDFVGILIYRIDVNLRASTILGVVGAGGVGYLLNQALTVYHFSRATTIIIVIILIVFGGELISARLRAKYSGGVEP